MAKNSELRVYYQYINILNYHIMKVNYEVDSQKISEISTWGCFASCCWRFATGSQGQQ